MRRLFIFISILFVVLGSHAQKDSLQLGDRYAEDQLYFSVNYALFAKQPTVIERSRFSYGLSAGFMKDFILNKQGSFSVALGLGYGFEYYNHNLKVEELNNTTNFNSLNADESAVFKSQNLEFPIELRWRTSTANKYKFWRVYSGIKFLYNLNNEFITETIDSSVSFQNITAYNNFQYGLTLSVGYDLFNLNVFYNLSNLFNNATFNNEVLETSTLKFGLIFYVL